MRSFGVVSLGLVISRRLVYKVQMVKNSRKRGRPANNGGEYADTREALIRNGVQTLSEQGFLTTSIDSLLKQVQVPKGSFYHYFGSKQAFGQAVIERYAEVFERKLERHLGNEALPALERLRAFVHEAQQGMAKHDFQRGCLVGHLAQELGRLHPTFAEQLEGIFNDWQRAVCRCLEQAKAEKTLSESADCEALANFYWLAWEGAVMRAKLCQSLEPLQTFEVQYFRLLQAS